MDSGTTAVINYLELRTEVDRVLLKEKSKCSSDAFMRWEEKSDCELPEDLKKFYSMSDGLEIRWSVKTSSKNPVPTYLGKMFINPLNDLARITTSGSKQMAVDELNDFTENDTPRFNSASWHIFELDPCDGQGRICLVYNPNLETSIWYLDRSLHFHRLASTFTEYYRLLLLHCGLPYWYYKYTDSGIPPYILHWYYTIAPSLFLAREQDDTISTSLIPFNPDKVFQRNTNPQSKGAKASNLPGSAGVNPIAQASVGARSATQNQKRPTQQMKGINRSSSVPRSMNN